MTCFGTTVPGQGPFPTANEFSFVLAPNVQRDCTYTADNRQNRPIRLTRTYTFSQRILRDRLDGYIHQDAKRSVRLHQRESGENEWEMLAGHVYEMTVFKVERHRGRSGTQ